MQYSKVHAYVRTSLVANVESALQDIGVHGFSYCRVRGMGEYANFFNPDPHVVHARFEVFVACGEVDAVVEAIYKAAHSGLPGDGLIAVLPVDRLVHIKAPESV